MLPGLNNKSQVIHNQVTGLSSTLYPFCLPVVMLKNNFDNPFMFDEIQGGSPKVAMPQS